jgi:hypothetical protein
VSGQLSALLTFIADKKQVIMEEEIKLREFKVRIRGNKINRDPFEEVFIVSASNKREASKQVDRIMGDTSPLGILYKYGHCEERFIAEIEPIF